MTATAVAPQRSARDRVFQNAQSVNQVENVDAPRFFVQMGWSSLETDTEAIPGKTLLRGEITPCRSFRQKSNIHEIPEGMRIPGADEVDVASGDRRVIWGYYWKRALDEATRLAELEGKLDPNRRMGIVEVKSLAGLRSVLYDQYDFNEIFYPDGIFNLPATNAELKAYLQARVAEFQTMNLPSDLKPVLLELGAELIAAVETADKAQADRVDFAHRCMQLSPTDSSGFYKKGYDALDEESLLRTGKPRVGEALETQAKALHLLAEDKASGGKDDPVFALVKATEDANKILREELAAQREQTNQLLTILVSQSSAKAEEAPKAAKPEKKAA